MNNWQWASVFERTGQFPCPVDSMRSALAFRQPNLFTFVFFFWLFCCIPKTRTARPNQTNVNICSTNPPDSVRRRCVCNGHVLYPLASSPSACIHIVSRVQVCAVDFKALTHTGRAASKSHLLFYSIKLYAPEYLSILLTHNPNATVTNVAI